MTEVEFRDWLGGDGGEVLWKLVWGKTALPDRRPERYGLTRHEIRQQSVIHALEAVRQAGGDGGDPKAVLERAIADAVNDMRRDGAVADGPVSIGDVKLSTVDPIPDCGEADAEAAVLDLLDRFGAAMVRRTLDRLCPSHRAALRAAYMGDELPASVTPAQARNAIGKARRKFAKVWKAG